MDAQIKGMMLDRCVAQSRVFVYSSFRMFSTVQPYGLVCSSHNLVVLVSLWYGPNIVTYALAAMLHMLDIKPY